MRGSLDAVLLVGVLAGGCGGATVGRGSSPGTDAAVRLDASGTDASKDAPDGALADAPSADASPADAPSVDAPSVDAPSDDASPPDGAATCVISASNYDQSCTADSDCVSVAGTYAVVFGNYWCSSECTCGGPRGVINRDSVARYVRDVSATPLGSGALSAEPCPCETPLPPSDDVTCCRNGQCTTDPGVCPAYSNAVLCALDGGASDASYSSDIAAVAGSSRWCPATDVCAELDAGWECCAVLAGILGCSIP